jgi:hypothetical protein
MGLRREPIYITREAWRGLWLLSKASEKSPDEIANDMILADIAKNFPELVLYQAEQNKREQALIKTLGVSR